MMKLPTVNNTYKMAASGSDSDENKSCDYHCSNCSKIRAVDETDAAASHRANDRMKLVNAERARLDALTLPELRIAYVERFGSCGSYIPAQTMRLKLLWAFIGKNSPSAMYRKAGKLFDAMVSSIVKPEDIYPEMEEACRSLERILMYTTQFDKSLMTGAIANPYEPLEHKLGVLDKYSEPAAKYACFARSAAIDEYRKTIDAAYAALRP